MSRENVEVLKESIERFNRNDIPGMLRLLDPEIRFEHRMAELELEGGLNGVDAVGKWMAEMTGYFASWEVECDDFRDLGDQVLALGSVRAVGKESGVETELPWAVVAGFRNGLCTHFTDYADRELALEAAGLRE